MSLDSGLGSRLRLPLIAAPMLRVSGPDLVSAACCNGVIGGAGGQTGRANGMAFVRAVRAFYDGPVILADGISGRRSAVGNPCAWLRPCDHADPNDPEHAHFAEWIGVDSWDPNAFESTEANDRLAAIRL